MKYLLLIPVLLLTMYSSKGQQNLFFNDYADSAKSRFELKGQGSFNADVLKTFYASGKINGQFNFYNEKDDLFSSFLIGINKNASNTDSINISDLIFPELGSAALVANYQYFSVLKDFTNHKRDRYLTGGPFFDFNLKSVRSKDDSTDKKILFDILNYTTGYTVRYIIKDKKYPISVGAQVYFTFHNLPNEDTPAFQIFLKSTDNTKNYKSAGMKFNFNIKDYKFYIDTRHIFNDKNIKNSHFNGFQYNIGTAINTTMFNL